MRKISHFTWFRYISQKVEYSFASSVKNYRGGQIADNEVFDSLGKTLFQGKLTYLHRSKGKEMLPMVSGDGCLLVRKLPEASPKTVFIGDVVVLKDPEKSDGFLVRRLAAIEGCEMVSPDEKDEPFILEKDQCWIVSDNDSLKPNEARDSRMFGPLNLSSIVGRAMYCLRTVVDHGPVQNSQAGMIRDLPVLTVELDVNEMREGPET